MITNAILRKDRQFYLFTIVFVIFLIELLIYFSFPLLQIDTTITLIDDIYFRFEHIFLFSLNSVVLFLVILFFRKIILQFQMSESLLKSKIDNTYNIKQIDRNKIRNTFRQHLYHNMNTKSHLDDMKNHYESYITKNETGIKTNSFSKRKFEKSFVLTHRNNDPQNHNHSQNENSIHRINQALNKIRRAMIHLESPTDVIRVICKIMVREKLADTSFTALSNIENSVFEIVACEGTYRSKLLNYKIPIENPAEQNCSLLKSNPNYSNCLFSCNQQNRESCFLFKFGFESFISLPIEVDGSLIGILVLLSKKPHQFNQTLLTIYETLTRDVEHLIEDHKEKIIKTELEQRLKQNEYLFRTIFEKTRLGIIVYRTYDRIISANDAFLKMIKLPEDYFKYVNLDYFVADDERELISSYHNRLRNGELEYYQYEATLVDVEGKTCYVRATISTVRNKKGDVDFFVTIIEDISTDKEYEKLLQRKEERYRYFIKSNSNGILRLELSQSLLINIEDINQAIEHLIIHSYIAEANLSMIKFLNCSSEDEMYFKPSYNYISELFVDEHLLFEFFNSNCVLKNYSIEKKDNTGHTKYYSVNMNGIVENGQLERIWIVFSDITDERLKEQQQRKYNEELEEYIEERTRLIWRLNEKYRSLVEGVSDLIWELDEQLNIISINEQVKDVLGYDIDEIFNHPITDLMINNHEAELFASIVQDALKTHSSFRYFRCELSSKDKNSLLFDMSGSVYFDENISCYIIQGLSRNITSKTMLEGLEQSNEQLKQRIIEQNKDSWYSKERFRNLVETSSDIIWETDKEGKLLFVSQKVKDILGYNPEEIKKISFNSFFSEQDDFSLLHFNYKNFEMVEVNVKSKNRGNRILEISGAPYLDDDGIFAGYRGVARDITSKKNYEKQQALFRFIVEASNDAVFTTKSDGLVTSWNKGAENIYGYKETEILNKHINVTIPIELRESVNSKIQNLIIEKKSFIIEDTVRMRKNGEIFDALVRVSPLCDNNNIIFGVSAIVTDITERKEAERSLEHNLKLLQALIDSIPNPIFYTTNNNKIIGCNKSFEDFSEKKKDTLINKYIDEVLNAAFVKNYSKNLNLFYKKGGTQIIEHVEMHNKDVKRFYRIYKSVFNLNGFQQSGIVSTIVDVSGLKRMEKALKKHSDFLQVLIDAIPDPVYYKDTNLNFLGCNKAFETFANLNKPEMYRKDIFEHVYKEDADFHRFREQCVLKEKYRLTYESNIRFFHRKEVTVIINIAPFYNEYGEIDGLIGTFHDITERKIMEHKLKNTLAEKSTILENALVGMAQVNARNIVWSNNKLTEIFQCKSQTLAGTKIEELLKCEKDNERNLKDYLEKFEREGEASFECNTLSMNKTKLCLQIFARFIDQKNEELGSFWIFEDITHKKTIQEKLRETLAERNVVVDNSHTGIFWEKLEKLVWANRKFEEISGYDLHEILRKDISTFAYDKKHYKKEIKRAATKLKKGQSYIFEMEAITKNGTKILTRNSGRSINPENVSEGTIWVVEDITEQRKKEEHYKKVQQHLFKTKKLASLGQLLAGITHEINNPINFVYSSVCNLKNKYDKVNKFFSYFESNIDSNENESDTVNVLQKKFEEYRINKHYKDMQTLIDTALDGSERIISIIKGVQQFGRVIQKEKDWVDINSRIDAVLNLLYNKYKKRIKIVRDNEEDVYVMCNVIFIDQVFVNIINNAIDAIAGHGTIVIKTFTKDNFAHISISDTGSGMTEEIRTNIFDPFYTTKDVGKGSGLGLYISYEIVKKHKGDIIVSTKDGSGTTFTVVLPIRQEEEQSLLLEER